MGGCGGGVSCGAGCYRLCLPCHLQWPPSCRQGTQMHMYIQHIHTQHALCILHACCVYAIMMQCIDTAQVCWEGTHGCMHAQAHVCINVKLYLNACMGYDADYISRAGQIHKAYPRWDPHGGSPDPGAVPPQHSTCPQARQL